MAISDSFFRRSREKLAFSLEDCALRTARERQHLVDHFFHCLGCVMLNQLPELSRINASMP